jgi:hypothetical protein
MQIRSFRESGKPAWVNAYSNACFRLGPDPRRALRPHPTNAANIIQITVLTGLSPHGGADRIDASIVDNEHSALDWGGGILEKLPSNKSSIRNKRSLSVSNQGFKARDPGELSSSPWIELAATSARASNYRYFENLRYLASAGTQQW